MPNRGARLPKTSAPGNPHLLMLQERVRTAPTQPGIYRWKNEKGDVLYVGKAKNLRKRLSQYVNPGKGMHGPWRQAFLKLIADFDVTVTRSEIEALILETNLIKQLRPKYNVLMKDGKNYLYIRVTMQDTYPRVETSRKMWNDGSKFFGPYMNSEDVRITLDILQETIGYRACRQSLDALNKNPDASPESLRTCLEYQIGKCNGLCAGAITREVYLERINKMIEFLKGKHDDVRALLQARMKTAAAEQKFELAARLRNFLTGLDRMDGKGHAQLASDTTGEDSDVIGLAILSNRAHVVILKRRNGRIVDEWEGELTGEAKDDPAEVLSQFLPQYYGDDPSVPPQILLPVDVPDRETIEKWMTETRGRKVTLIVPERGRKSHLVQLAEKNAREKAKLKELKWESDKANTEAALEGLKRILELPTLPIRIEGYDISHLGGTETVGSMVVMKNGKAANDHYRSFTIRTMKSGVIDDYRSLKEVLSRRLRRFCEDLPQEEKQWKEKGVTFGKAKKSEQKALEEIHAAHPEDLSSEGIVYKNYLVGRKDNKIITMGRLIKFSPSMLELKSIWVDGAWRGQKLGQFLGRKLLRAVKKGKVYVTIDPKLEEYYGELGFRYVIKPPQIIHDEIEKALKNHPRPETVETLVMMWEAHQNKPDVSLSAKPDLIVIDGGKGQLSAVMEVMKGCALDIPVIGLAKREEEVFVSDRSDPILFPKDSQAKFVLMRLRDEAHRFANRHREKRLTSKTFASALDTIPGIGEKSKEELLQRFGTVAGIRDATDEMLGEILSKEQVRMLRQAL